MRRPKFNLPDELLKRWIEVVEMRTILIPLLVTATLFLRDPADAVFLAAAIASEADFLITGDNDLLGAKLSISTRIVSVAEFAGDAKIA